MPRSYAPQFRAMVIEQVRNGRRVADVAASVDLPQATVFRWVRQDRIDRGELPGTSTQESTELRAARRRIAELEAELATHQARVRALRTGSGGAPKSAVPYRGDVGP
jgi:transposase